MFDIKPCPPDVRPLPPPSGDGLDDVRYRFSGYQQVTTILGDGMEYVTLVQDPNYGNDPMWWNERAVSGAFGLTELSVASAGFIPIDPVEIEVEV